MKEDPFEKAGFVPGESLHEDLSKPGDVNGLYEILVVEKPLPEGDYETLWERSPEELLRLCLISVEEGGNLPTAVEVIGGEWRLKYKPDPEPNELVGVLIPYYLFYRHEHSES